MIELLITLVILTNAQRTTPVVPDLELSQRAQVRAEYLCKHNQWSHEGWLDSFKGITAPHKGENLAYGFANTQATQQGWLNSPSHKRNIVNPNFTYMGVGESCGITVVLFHS